MEKRPPGTIAKTKARGASLNENHRFTNMRMEIDPGVFDELSEEERPLLHTQFFKDASRSILNKNDSPDLGFGFSVNFYRGCEHGCIYCYARPTHEYLNLSAGLDFESKIFVKEQAPQLLRQEFMAKRWQPQVVMMSGVTDCYQPAERQFKITRECLKVFNQFRNPVSIITKNALVTRDIDILKELAEKHCVSVTLSITSLNDQVAKVMEPRASVPAARLKAITALAENGIPVSVNVAPIVPGITDHEIPVILKAAADAGAQSAGYVVVRLPYSVKDLFVDWLERPFPEKKSRVLALIRDMRGQKLYDANFGTRMTGVGQNAENIVQMFYVFRKKYGLDRHRDYLSLDNFRCPSDQTDLFQWVESSLDNE